MQWPQYCLAVKHWNMLRNSLPGILRPHFSCYSNCLAMTGLTDAKPSGNKRSAVSRYHLVFGPMLLLSLCEVQPLTSALIKSLELGRENPTGNTRYQESFKINPMILTFSDSPTLLDDFMQHDFMTILSQTTLIKQSQPSSQLFLRSQMLEW